MAIPSLWIPVQLTAIEQGECEILAQDIVEDAHNRCARDGYDGRAWHKDYAGVATHRAFDRWARAAFPPGSITVNVPCLATEAQTRERLARGIQTPDFYIHGRNLRGELKCGSITWRERFAGWRGQHLTIGDLLKHNPGHVRTLLEKRPLPDLLAFAIYDDRKSPLLVYLTGWCSVYRLKPEHASERLNPLQALASVQRLWT